jgi:hypothetical protein
MPKPRHADLLKEMGCTASLDEFRDTLAAVKAEMFPDLTDEELAFTRDQAGDFVAEVKKRLNASKLTRVFVLRALVGLRKNPRSRKPKGD